VAVDNKLALLSMLKHISPNPNLMCAVVQMGTNPVHRDEELRHIAVQVPVTMYSWGARDERVYSRRGEVPSRFIPVGSTKVTLAKRKHPMRIHEKKWDICIVSMFSSQTLSHKNPSEFVEFEVQTMPNLVALLAPIISRHQLRVVVALRSGQDVLANATEDEEIDFYRSSLHGLAELSSHHLPYGSYLAASDSRLVLGRSSALLAEFLGTDTRVLFVNVTKSNIYDAPPEIPFKLSNPTEEQLEAKILELLRMTDNQYKEATEQTQAEYCVQLQNPLQVIADDLVSGGAFE